MCLKSSFCYAYVGIHMTCGVPDGFAMMLLSTTIQRILEWLYRSSLTDPETFKRQGSSLDHTIAAHEPKPGNWYC